MTVFAPEYIDITADTSHSSTPSLRIAQLITSLGTLSKAFSISTKPKYHPEQVGEKLLIQVHMEIKLSEGRTIIFG